MICFDAETFRKDLDRGRARTPVGSSSYLPAIFGCTMAGFVIRALPGEPLPLGE